MNVGSMVVSVATPPLADALGLAARPRGLGPARRRRPAGVAAVPAAPAPPGPSTRDRGAVAAGGAGDRVPVAGAAGLAAGAGVRRAGRRRTTRSPPGCRRCWPTRSGSARAPPGPPPRCSRSARSSARWGCRCWRCAGRAGSRSAWSACSGWRSRSSCCWCRRPTCSAACSAASPRAAASRRCSRWWCTSPAATGRAPSCPRSCRASGTSPRPRPHRARRGARRDGRVDRPVLIILGTTATFSVLGRPRGSPGPGAPGPLPIRARVRGGCRRTTPAPTHPSSRPRGDVVERVVRRRRHARPAHPRAVAGLDPPPPRVPPRGAAERGGVAAGHRVPHRRRAHHRRPAAGVHPALRRARRLDADDHDQQRGARDATEATVFGPFFVEGSPDVGLGGDIAGGAAGEPCWVEGTVTDTDGRPSPGPLEVWEADAEGCYDVQYDDDRVAGRGHLFTDDRRPLPFWAVTPTPYPIPHDGPVGELLARHRPLADARRPPPPDGRRRRAAARWSPTSSRAATTSSTPTASSGCGTPWSWTSTAARRDADPRRP